MPDVSHIDLTTLPPDIWHDLSSYLDTGDFVSLAGVNQSLSRTPTSNSTLLSFLLRHRMKINYSPRSRRPPYEVIVSHIRKRRCRACRGMEHTASNVKWNSLFGMKLCPDCRQSEKFKMIMATRAKTEHKLNESDLSALKVIHIPNPHCRNLSEMRLYALTEVRRVSEAKMEAKGTTLEDAKRKGEQRSEAVKRRKLEAKESRSL